MKNILSKAVSSLSIIVLIVVTALGPQVAIAASFTSSKDTATRVEISQTADHTIVFTLPTSMDFDSTGTTDFLRVDFPASFTLGGTWVAGDFTFNDGTSRTINAVEQGAGDVDCTVASGVNNVCISVDTTNNIFTIKPSSNYTASAAAATITFTIDGTSTDGTLTNPSSVAATSIDFQHCDNVASCDTSFAATHSSQIAFAIIDDDTVAVTAIVGSSITFDIDTASGGGNGDSNAPYAVALGTITTTDTRVSGTTDVVQMIVLEGDTSGAGGMVVTVANANGANGLKSTSTPADDIGSADGTMADGTENYGLCVATSGLTGFSRASPYNSGSCATNTETNDIQGLTTAGENIVNSGGAPVAGAQAEVIVNAAISTSTVAHNDYSDTLTFIATGTF